MYNRYNDIRKFITDDSKLKIENGSEVYISSEENYDIVVDLDDRIDEFDKIKPLIVFVAKNVCELDNIVQRFDRKCLNGNQFPYELEIIYIDKPNFIKFQYWGTTENTMFDVVFKYENNKFVLKSFGLCDNIPADWDKEI